MAEPLTKRRELLDKRVLPELSEPGAWQKMRVNQEQEFVIARYTPSPKHFDAPMIGYYDGGKLIYAARTRNGFTPASQMQLFKKDKATGDRGLPIRESTGEKGQSLGSGPDRGEDVRMPMAKTRAGWSV